MSESVRFFDMIAADPQFKEQFGRDADLALAEFPDMSEIEKDAIRALELETLEELVDAKPMPVECRILQISW